MILDDAERGPLEQRLAALSPAKKALLEARLLERAARRGAGANGAAARGRIEHVVGLGPYPLAFAQEQLWLREQLHPGTMLSNVTTAVRLRGPLDHPALQAALDALVARHEPLRTTIELIDGKPVQIVSEPRSIELPLADCSGLQPSQQQVAAQDLIQKQMLRPFDLTRDVMMRALLVRLGIEDHVLVRTGHHIASDGWSDGIIQRDLSTLYTAFHLGLASPPLPTLPIRYRDFAVWQHTWLAPNVLDAQLKYWIKQLHGAPALLQLPTDRPRPSQRSLSGASVRMDISHETVDSLGTLSRKNSATLFMALVAGLDVLLYRYTGQEDVVIGSPTAGRSTVETEQLVGCFINTLAFRTDLSGDPTFREVLQRVRDVAHVAYSRADVPFQKVVEALRPERNASYSPVFQVLFTFQNTPSESLSLPDLTVEPYKVESRASEFDLSLTVEKTSRGLGVTADYNTDLFDGANVERLLGHYRELLCSAVATPDAPVGRMQLLTSAERERILHAFNATRTDRPAGVCIHHLVEAQAALTPAGVAVSSEDQQLTYAELDQRANRLARHLQSLGVGPETVVGVCLDRTTEMLVGILGILKAGGAYLPLDPSYPTQRLAFMLSDTAAPVVVIHEHLAPKLPKYAGRTVRLDTDWTDIARQSDTPVETRVGPDTLAYIIYTSGSTGVPKGVMVTHGSVVNLLRSMSSRPGLGSEDVLLAVTTLSFDMSVVELLLPLTVGGKVVIATHSVASDAARLIQALAASGATVMQATPATWRMLLYAGWIGDGRLTMLCGGEALSRELADALLQRGGKLWNLYGPTESTVYATAQPVERSDAPVSIGRPIANAELYVLDRYLEPVPIGVAAEVYIGGAPLARGYLNRPELTSERFIPHPFEGTPGARLYRTGDVGRWRPDGTLELLGRLDEQVKIRGFRVELGEVEVALGRCAGVQQAVVALQEDRPGDQRLTAYIVPERQDSPPTAAELRSALRERLPDYMVPSIFVMLDRMPLTANGKVDRHALAATLAAPNALGEELHVPPRTPNEVALARIWAELLKIEPVGVHDNFFDLGGHSLLAVQMFAQMREELGVDLPIASLFPDATIAHLCRGLEAADHPSSGSSTLVPIQPRGSRPPLFCIHAIDGEVVRYAHLARHLGEEQPFYGLRARGLDDGEKPFTDISEMAAHYVAQMRKVSDGPYLVGGFSFGGAVAAEVATQLVELGQEVALLAIFDTPLDGSAFQPVGQLRGLGPDLVAYVQHLLEPGQRLRFVRGELPAVWRALAWLLRIRKTPPHMQSIESLVSSMAGSSSPHERVARIHLGALARFTPRPYPGRVTLFRARVRPLLASHDAVLGWNSLARGGVEVYPLPGSHAQMFEEPHVATLAELLLRVSSRCRTD